jgi:hypothetical protein
MPCDEFLPVNLICVASKFGSISTVQRRPLFKAPFQLVEISAVLQNNVQLGNLTLLLQPAPLLPAFHCSQRASDLVCQRIHIVHRLKHEQQRHEVIQVLPKKRQKLAKTFLAV